MDPTQGLITDSATLPSPKSACPECGADRGDRIPCVVPFLGNVAVVRCGRCGARAGTEDDPRRMLTCSECALPYLEHPTVEPGATRCAACAGGTMDVVHEDPSLAAAAEKEVLDALGARWSWLGGTDVTDYLDRIRHDLAAASPSASAIPPGTVRIFDDDSVRVLGLPSGDLLLSSGLLRTMTDEAELAFLLARALAHVAGGDAGRWLSRIGLRELARGGATSAEACWAGAAETVLRIGFGSEREHAADREGVETLAAAGYDPAAALRLLKRWSGLISDRAPEMAEVALAHPPISDRADRVAVAVRGLHGTGSGGRINREVFRRVAGHGVLAENLHPEATPPNVTTATGRRRAAWLTIAAIALLAAGFLLFAVL